MQVRARRRSGVGGSAGARQEPLACAAGSTSGRVKLRSLHPSARFEKRVLEPGEVAQVRSSDSGPGMTESATGRDESPSPGPPFEVEVT